MTMAAKTKTIAKSPRRLVSLTETEELLGVSKNTVKGWVRRGCPIPERGAKLTAWKIDLGLLLEWRVNNSVTEALTTDTADVGIQEARRRRLMALAEQSEIDLALRRGDAVSIKDVGEIWKSLVLAFRAKMLAMPHKFAPELAAEANPRAVYVTLQDAIYDALNELADETIERNIAEENI